MAFTARGNTGQARSFVQGDGLVHTVFEMRPKLIKPRFQKLEERLQVERPILRHLLVIGNDDLIELRLAAGTPGYFCRRIDFPDLVQGTQPGAPGSLAITGPKLVDAAAGRRPADDLIPCADPFQDIQAQDQDMRGLMDVAPREQHQIRRFGLAGRRARRLQAVNGLLRQL